MKSSASSRRRGSKAFGLLIAAGLVSGVFSVKASAQPKDPAAAAPSFKPTAEPGTLSAEERQKREEWRRSISQVATPKQGCFNSSYPSLEWHEVPCGAPSNFPNPPAKGPRPNVVGNGNDITAVMNDPGFISSATGSFDSVTPAGVTVSGPWGSGLSLNPNTPNAFTLQINSQFFWSPPACNSLADCYGWQQFIYSQNQCGGPCIFMEYWLINYGSPCPPSPPGLGPWIQAQNGKDCWFNSVSAGAPAVTAAQLTWTTLTGTAAAGSDQVMLTFVDPILGTSTASATGLPSVLSLAQQWATAEFNIFGDCCLRQANFSAGTTVVTRTQVNNGTNTPPTCVAQGFTGETNNLSFGPSPPAASGAGPALIFTSSIAGGLPSNCAAATSVGDTHMTTFGGLLYDFQAAGDFLLAQTGPDFVVQTRQVSGAPTWPNATLNKAVAVQAGKSRVAICLAPSLVAIDGKPVRLRDGIPLQLPGGGDVILRGNYYAVRGPGGDSVIVVNNTSHFDVLVGLGRWPTQVSGLLANGSTGINSIETRSGNALTSPFSYQALYGSFAEGWRVPASESMLSPCGRDVASGVPKKLFFARDLDPQLAKRTQAVCAKAGVKEGPLLDACTLDVAVIGSSNAAKVFANKPNPVVVGDAK
jgi:hypothetical protein